MAFVIDFERRIRGGRGTRGGGKDDLYASHVGGGDADRGRSLALRLSKQCMERIRWIVGDYVVASIELGAETKGSVWTLRRVAGADANGCKLSGQGRDDGCATVRFALDDASLDKIFPGGRKGHFAELGEFDGVTAKFVVNE